MVFLLRFLILIFSNNDLFSFLLLNLLLLLNIFPSSVMTQISIQFLISLLALLSILLWLLCLHFIHLGFSSRLIDGLFCISLVHLFLSFFYRIEINSGHWSLVRLFSKALKFILEYLINQVNIRLIDRVSIVIHYNHSCYS